MYLPHVGNSLFSLLLLAYKLLSLKHTLAFKIITLPPCIGDNMNKSTSKLLRLPSSPSPLDVACVEVVGQSLNMLNVEPA